MISKLVFLIFSYCIGALPFVFFVKYGFSRWVKRVPFAKTENDILKIQLFIIALFDFLKGLAIVLLAKQLGYSELTQVLSACFCILGHNWSIFMSFQGGRGLSTYLGALLGFSTQVFIYSCFGLALFSFVFGSGIATMLVGMLAIVLGRIFDPWGVTLYFALWSLLPMLIKRLSPYKDYATAKNKAVLLKSRFYFDSDQQQDITLFQYYKNWQQLKKH